MSLKRQKRAKVMQFKLQPYVIKVQYVLCTAMELFKMHKISLLDFRQHSIFY